MNKVLELKNINRFFVQGGQKLEVLKDINLTIEKGEVVALVGASGSGKSTLLHVAGLLDKADSGEMIIAGSNAAQAQDDERTHLRSRYLGFIYQFHHLLPELSAAENVAVPLMIAGVEHTKAHMRALALLKGLGLANRATHRPGELSGGEQQRVAIARAIANNPSLILADEPTGNLDPTTSESVFKIFMDLARMEGLSAIVATHNMELAKRMDRMLVLKGGTISVG